MHRYVIERAVPGIHTLDAEGLCAGARRSNEALAELGPDIQWLESFVVADRTFCVYLARDEDVIRLHAERSGFPATKIHRVERIIDPTTATAPAGVGC